MDALQLLADDKFDRTLGSIKRDIASFAEDTPLDKIWDEMLSKDEQIAVIINEYGSFQGILTLEDVIETLLGSEIVDEKDTVRDMQQFARDKWKKIHPEQSAAVGAAADDSDTAAQPAGETGSDSGHGSGSGAAPGTKSGTGSKKLF